MCTEPKSYDLVVLGGGPAGITGAATAAAFGKSVAVIDKHHELGGAGINTGTVPSKTLRETALTLSGACSRNPYGVDLSLRRDATVGDFMRHERAVKSSMNAMLAGHLAASQAVVYNGTGVFEDAHTIRIHPAAAQHDDTGATAQTDFVRGTHILIATGSSPVRPSIFPFDRPGRKASPRLVSAKPTAKLLDGSEKQQTRAEGGYCESTGDCGTLSNPRRLLRKLVAGEGSEPSTFGL